LSTENGGRVSCFRDIAQSGLRVNGGFFIFRRDILDYIEDGDELVLEPFQRLVRDHQLLAYDYDGFWLPMDTAKDKKRIEDLYAAGNPPWEVWRKDAAQPRTDGSRPEVRRGARAAPAGIDR